MNSVYSKIIKYAYIPECSQCLHFSKPTGANIDLGICSKFGKKNIISGNIIYFFARDCRNLSELCGIDGKYFLHNDYHKRNWAIEANKYKTRDQLHRPERKMRQTF